MRSSMMTGVFEASDSSKPRSTMRTMVASLGRGSSSHIDDLSATAWVRSCDHARALAVVLADHDQRAADARRAEARYDSASEATLVPTIDFQVTAPRIG